MTKEEFKNFVDETIAAPVEELTAAQVSRRFAKLRVEYPTAEDRKNLEGLTAGQVEVYEHMRALPLLRSLQKLFPDWNDLWFKAEDIEAETDEERREKMQQQAAVLEDVDVEFFDTEYFTLLENYAKSFLRLVGMYESCIDAHALGCDGCIWQFRSPDGNKDCKPRLVFGAPPKDWNLDRFMRYLEG